MEVNIRSIQQLKIATPSCDLNDLRSYVRHDNIRSFRLGIKSTNSPEDINALLFESAYEEKAEFMDLIIERVDTLVKHDYSNRKYKQCLLNSLRCCTELYFDVERTETHKNNLRLLLENAIEYNYFDTVGMLLYYRTDVNLKNNMTAFMYSLICECNDDIQKVLIEYEVDFNLCHDGMSTLFLAIKFGSPLALEVIKRGGDVNFHTDACNAVCLALTYVCDPTVFRIIWENFDYEIWKSSFSKSVLLKFVQNDMPAVVWKEYAHIFMENETKLRLDLEHHRNSFFFKSDLLICNFYLRCLRSGIQIETADSFVLHLLSHGSDIFTDDIDVIYNELHVFTPLLNSLLYMDLLYNDDEYYNSFIYFKYYPVPDLNTFMVNVAVSSENLTHTLKTVKKYCAISKELQTRVLDILGTEDLSYECCEKILKTSTTFPSLLQLSRDSTRRAICLKYNIRTSCKLHTAIRHLPLPKCIKDILFYNIPMYYPPTECN